MVKIDDDVLQNSISTEDIVMYYEARSEKMNAEMNELKAQLEVMEVALMHTGFYDDETEIDFIDEKQCEYSADPPKPPVLPTKKATTKKASNTDIEAFIRGVTKSMKTIIL